MVVCTGVVLTAVAAAVVVVALGAALVTAACVVVVCVLSSVPAVVSAELPCGSLEDTVFDAVVLLCEAEEAEVCLLLSLSDDSPQPESRNAAASEIVSSFLFIRTFIPFKSYVTL